MQSGETVKGWLLVNPETSKRGERWWYVQCTACRAKRKLRACELERAACSQCKPNGLALAVLWGKLSAAEQAQVSRAFKSRLLVLEPGQDKQRILREFLENPELWREAAPSNNADLYERRNYAAIY